MIRNLTKHYVVADTGPGGMVFEMPGVEYALWVKFLTWPARLGIMLARAPFRALFQLLRPGRVVQALDELNLTINRGEVFGLLGPNGAGKTTTINLILGLIWPTSGRVYVMGLPPGDMEAKRLIGFLPEETYLYRHLDAVETLQFYGKLFGLRGLLLDRRVDELLDLVGLDRSAARRPLSTYSKGMARRIGLAQALINDPEILILDEPTSGLDPVGSLQMKDLILKIKKAGKTILMCSHLLGDVEDICDRAVMLYRGRIAVEGRIEELLAVKDVFQLQARGVSPEAAQKLAETVAAAGGQIENIGYQRTRLENIFRDVVLRRVEQERQS